MDVEKQEGLADTIAKETILRLRNDPRICEWKDLGYKQFSALTAMIYVFLHDYAIFED